MRYMFYGQDYGKWALSYIDDEHTKENNLYREKLQAISFKVKTANFFNSAITQFQVSTDIYMENDVYHIKRFAITLVIITKHQKGPLVTYCTGVGGQSQKIKHGLMYNDNLQKDSQRTIKWLTLKLAWVG